MSEARDPVAAARAGGEGDDRPFIFRYYESNMFDPLVAEFTGETDFHDFGYWEDGVTNHIEACERLMDKLLELMPVKGGRLLDVACGKGATTRYLTRHFLAEQITGVDMLDKALESARGNVPGATFLKMDATSLDFEDASFDVVISVEAAFHFVTREDFLRQAFRVLKPGGWLVVADTLATEEAEERRPGRHVQNYLPGPDAYRAVLERVGFGQVAVHDVTEPCWHGLYWEVIRFVHRKLLAKEVSLERMSSFLEATYARVPDLTCYLLAAAQKP